ncbi:MAG: GGDEF domain-containing protein [Treponema sp.]|nr:GGDEF domain-containing protein [Treponema sp.]
MDFQSIVDSYAMAAAVYSVEKTGDGHWGAIRIVKANKLYQDTMLESYHENMRYDEVIPRERNFEEYCYRCAVLKQHLHAYVDTKSMGVWCDGTYIPLSADYDTDKLSYFVFYLEFTKAPEAERMSDLSAEASSQVIQTCIKLRGTEHFTESMQAVIEDISSITDAFGSVIMLIDKEQGKYAPLCASYRDKKAVYEDFAEYLTPEVVFSWEGTIGQHDNIIVKDEADMAELEKVNPVWVKSLKGAGVGSLILVPLVHGKQFYGVLFITNFDTSRLVEIKEFITLSAFFLSSEIASNSLLEQLEYLSNVDSLTGVRNRNSMNLRVDSASRGEPAVKTPFGVIFADLNGLKKCNDTGGHATGDRLLKNAALLLTELFGDEEIYRSGGDEFVVLLAACSRQDFERRVADLQEKSGYGKDVCFAVGASWTDGSESLRTCMHLADEAMYADKHDFYQKHPDMKRK